LETEKLSAQEWENRKVKPLVSNEEAVFAVLSLSDSELKKLKAQVKEAVSKNSGFQQAFEFAKPFIQKGLETALEKAAKK